MEALIFDLETTGLTDNRSVPLDKLPEAVEFCGLLIDFDTGRLIDELDILIKPHKPVPFEITKITGLNDEDLKDASPFAWVASRIRTIIQHAPLVIAHNASYDVEILDIEYQRAKLAPLVWPRIVCTVEATVHLQGHRLNLTALHTHLFGCGFPNAHRARTDVEALARCVAKLYQQGDI